MKKSLALSLVMFVILSACNTGKQKSTTGAVSQGDSTLTGFDPASLGSIISTIKFELNANEIEQKIFTDGIVPWISIEKPEDEIGELIKPDEIVVSSDKVDLVIDYPLSKVTTIELNHPGGFSRKDLIMQISKEYQRIYAEDEQTAKENTTASDNNGIASSGKYGIWGHELSDLDLSSVEVRKNASGKYSLYLNIES